MVYLGGLNGMGGREVWDDCGVALCGIGDGVQGSLYTVGVDCCRAVCVCFCETCLHIITSDLLVGCCAAKHTFFAALSRISYIYLIGVWTHIPH